jgi:hypothetical protein
LLGGGEWLDLFLPAAGKILPKISTATSAKRRTAFT